MADPYGIYKNQLAVKKAKIGDFPSGNYVEITNQGEIDLQNGGKVINGFELVTLSLKGAVVIDTFPFNTVTLTEAAAAYAKVEDGGVVANLSVSGAEAGYTANYQLFPDTEVVNDAAYFGADNVFGALYFDMSATVAVYGADALTWEYYNGTAWTALTLIYDNTDTTAGDGKRSFQQDGYVIFSAPTDWATYSVGGQLAYWIRARVSAAQITTIPLTNSKEHQIPSDDNASQIPYNATITRMRFNWDVVSTGTADTKLVLYNFNTGAATEMTITKALKDYAVNDKVINVAANDNLGWYVSQVDGGGTEYADGACEMKVTKI
jgi:hypothetical protein